LKHGISIVDYGTDAMSKDEATAAIREASQRTPEDVWVGLVAN